jgi:hypothetical protein
LTVIVVHGIYDFAGIPTKYVPATSVPLADDGFSRRLQPDGDRLIVQGVADLQGRGGEGGIADF